MGEEHARVAPALGAFAAGALEPVEADEVRAHLAACAACRIEAGRLARAAAWLGTDQEAIPPAGLRDAVLAGTRSGPPVPAEALAAATAELDELVGGLTDEQWRLPLIHGWDVAGLLGHLAAAGDRPGTVPGPDDELRRAFETWIHADDLRTALGRPPSPPPPGHLHGIIALGMRLLPPAGGAVALRLEGPGGGSWRVPREGAGPLAATITAEAVDFYYLMGNRRDPGEVATSVTGDRQLAAALLAAVATLGCD